MNDLAMVTARTALRDLAVRQRAISDNIANVETPGYLARKVEFEDALREAVASGDPTEATPTTVRSLDPTGVNGNNVSLDDETIALVETNLRYQLMVEAVNHKFGLLRAALRST